MGKTPHADQQVSHMFYNAGLHGTALFCTCLQAAATKPVAQTASDHTRCVCSHSHISLAFHGRPVESVEVTIDIASHTEPASSSLAPHPLPLVRVRLDKVRQGGKYSQASTISSSGVLSQGRHAGHSSGPFEELWGAVACRSQEYQSSAYIPEHLGVQKESPIMQWTSSMQVS